MERGRGSVGHGAFDPAEEEPDRGGGESGGHEDGHESKRPVEAVPGVHPLGHRHHDRREEIAEERQRDAQAEEGDREPTDDGARAVGAQP